MADVINSKVAGISLHQDVVDEVVPGIELTLQREKENKYDPNAIKILTKSGKHLGYVRKALAEKLAKLMDKGVNIQCFVSMVTGKDRPTKGVNLEIQCPHEFF